MDNLTCPDCTSQLHYHSVAKCDYCPFCERIIRIDGRRDNWQDMSEPNEGEMQ